MKGIKNEFQLIESDDHGGGVRGCNGVMVIGGGGGGFGGMGMCDP